MAIYKIVASRVNNITATEFTGQENELGQIWYDAVEGILRLYDGNAGGKIINEGGNGTPSQLANGTSNVVVYPNGNVAISVNGISNVIVFSHSNTFTGDVIASGNVSAGNVLANAYFYGNGEPFSGGTDYSNIPSNLLPATDSIYSLGSPDRRWSELYLTGNSIYLGNIVLRDDNGQFKVESDGTTIDLSATLTDRGADTNNWDNLTQMGLYTVDRNSWSGVTGAPLDSMVFVGVLEVLRTTDGDNTSITQCFMPGAQQADVTVQFTRSYWNGIWTGWTKHLNDNQILVGGTF